MVKQLIRSVAGLVLIAAALVYVASAYDSNPMFDNGALIVAAQ